MRTSSFPFCSIVKGRLHIIIPENVLKFAAENHPQFWNGETDASILKVTDSSVFMKEVERWLTKEAEDGSTMLTGMLDKAILEAVDYGCEGVDLAER